jgi:ribosomal-protein-alanine N-acetyltransferase
VLEVRASNTAAQRLYAGAGFERRGKRRGYYADGEDAIVMGRSL